MPLVLSEVLRLPSFPSSIHLVPRQELGNEGMAPTKKAVPGNFRETAFAVISLQGLQERYLFSLASSSCLRKSASSWARLWLLSESLERVTECPMATMSRNSTPTRNSSDGG